MRRQFLFELYVIVYRLSAFPTKLGYFVNFEKWRFLSFYCDK